MLHWSSWMKVWRHSWHRTGDLSCQNSVRRTGQLVRLDSGSQLSPSPPTHLTWYSDSWQYLWSRILFSIHTWQPDFWDDLHLYFSTGMNWMPELEYWSADHQSVLWCQMFFSETADILLHLPAGPDSTDRPQRCVWGHLSPPASWSSFGTSCSSRWWEGQQPAHLSPLASWRHLELPGC